MAVSLLTVARARRAGVFGIVSATITHTILRMEPVPSITRLGFRKWYERQLILSHAALVACVICMVAVAICLEQFTYRAPLSEMAVTLAVFAAAMVAGWKCFRYYSRSMTEVWRFGERSVCAQCGTYGRLNVLASGIVTPPATAREPAPESSAWMNVSCRKCGHLWRMPD